MRVTRALVVAAILGTASAPPAGAQAPAPHQHPAPAPPAADAPTPAAPLPAFVPPLTDADRAAAFPDVHGHTVHDTAVHTYVLFDQLEAQAGQSNGFSWDVKGWVGGNRHRFWLRTEGDHLDGRLEQAQTNLLYGRAISPWWSLMAGLRQDTLPHTPRTAMALGLEGIAPYGLEVEASLYVEPSGRAHVRLETEYELLLTNRLVAQPLMEFEIYGRDDPRRHIGAGLSTGEVGLRLRYEIRREVAPYLGVVWSHRFFGTGERAQAAGDRTGGLRLAAGVRLWM